MPVPKRSRAVRQSRSKRKSHRPGAGRVHVSHDEEPRRKLRRTPGADLEDLPTELVTNNDRPFSDPGSSISSRRRSSLPCNHAASALMDTLFVKSNSWYIYSLSQKSAVSMLPVDTAGQCNRGALSGCVSCTAGIWSSFLAGEGDKRTEHHTLRSIAENSAMSVPPGGGAPRFGKRLPLLRQSF